MRLDWAVYTGLVMVAVIALVLAWASTSEGIENCLAKTQLSEDVCRYALR